MGTDKTVRKRRIRDFIAVLRKYKISPDSDPHSIRLALEELGPTYIKLGQLMANRSDVLPPELCEELSDLRDEVEPMTAEEVDRAIFDAYGKKKEELFSYFDEEHRGSASIAQVHYARLKSGKEAAVKIQRIGAAEEMEADIEFLRRLVKRVPFVRNNPFIDVNEILDEFWNVTQQELDFVNEAKNLERFHELNRDVAYVTCPEVYPEFTTRTVIVMEFIRGIRITDREALEAHGYDMNEIGRKYVRSFHKQIFVDGFFQADPHIGNLLISDGRIVWYDMGMMGEFSRRDIDTFIGLIESIITKDVTRTFELACRMSVMREGCDKEAYFKDMSAFISSLYGINSGSFDPSVVFRQFFQIARRNKLSFNASHTIMSRGVMTVDGTLKRYFPDVDLFDEVKSFVTDYLRQTYSDKNADKRVEFLRKKAKAKKIAQIPENLASMVEVYSKGLVPIKIEMGVGEKTQAFITETVCMLTDALITAALLISSSIIVLSRLEPLILGIPALGFAGYSIAVLMMLIIYIGRLKKRYDSPEF